MITGVEMEVMDMLVDEFKNKPGFEREYFALGAMQDMLAALDTDRFYSASEAEKTAFVKEFADAIVNERERLEAESRETRWICVYKDTLCRHADNDNVVNIEVPADWLYKVLEADGVEDIDAWFDEYTADGTDSIARKAVVEGVILGCDDEYAMAAISFEKEQEHSDLLNRAKTVREWLEKLGEDIPEGLGFEHKGTWINNPFYDESLRFEVEPFVYYGVGSMTEYLQQAESIMSKAYEAKIDEAVRELFYVDENKTIELHADYRETSEFLWKTLHENAGSADLESIVHDKILEEYLGTIIDHENEVLERAGVIGEELEEDAGDYLHNTYFFEPPYDHFMKDEMKINILLATPEEKNNEYTSIAYQNYAMVNPERLTDPASSLVADTMIVRLLEQQGHSLKELQATMKDFREYFYDKDGFVKDVYAADGRKLSYEEKHAEFDKVHNAFLTSVCQELDNQTYEMGCLTVLAKVSVEDFIKLQQGAEVVMPKDAMLGIYNPWNGSGSVLEIELEKDFVFSTEMVRNMQIEGVKPDYEYTVDDAFGLVGSCWKEPVSISVPEKKKSLDTVIHSCEEMSKKTNNEHDSRSQENPKMTQMPGTEGDWGKNHWGSDKTDR